jgi:hypothetical protein
MAKFRNLTSSILHLTDENGITYKFNGGETRDGLSNYFYQHTSGGGGNPATLELIGELDGDGTIPAASNSNTVWQPGPSVRYAYTAAVANSATPAAVPVDTSDSASQRQKRVVLDMNNETAGQPRRIDSNFIGSQVAPTLRHLTEDLAISGLNAAKTATVETGYFPVAANGVRATAADAAENPAVTEGEWYTAFGVIAVTDASPSQTGTYYFSLKGTADIEFVAADDNPGSFPVPVVSGSAIVLATGVLTLATFTDGASGDSAEVDMVTALNPNTAAKMATVLSGTPGYKSGQYHEPVSGVTFIVDGTSVSATTPTATATVS